ncbi:hypothetical protein GLOIN_2v1559150 [Rhizophagus irregularis DAOM 181602=DAOM 197198]|uniref:Uncharacterized protein n=1 Tax=Rhizophagus irregularis (strain DAOM 181602 / DAOM 197198 / MUCL 43194) TaxID=747089 RepID=U9SU08_RHIID|nr:hypothetical protein GLOIN_2v1559150 [Rhizophagus irregularis DAOM 181602=DAOM 197198]POG76162.1 hypothetical protein GLOIN_2v1559150 [Rhizophagus irregularis DAOM 181602=DAOM 197198]GBC19610.1 hypothetical protein GLOIN_2v1559150 [Rhizophagus irregularis DAOM 181602=DAOM 197198]|eukprot:XP_025183028.1 hypothetical protein GLOIN_2v1559150 [Rhizophagus irregularis DAOM 181602=DAOM 197198]
MENHFYFKYNNKMKQLYWNFAKLYDLIYRLMFNHNYENNLCNFSLNNIFRLYIQLFLIRDYNECQFLIDLYSYTYRLCTL